MDGYGTDDCLATTTPKTTTHPSVTTAARLHKRDTPTTSASDSRVIQAKVSVQTETLVISPAALFLSVAIIILLIISTLIIYLVQNSQLRLLPRDFDSPASLLAAVYASEKLKAWSQRQHERQKIAGRSGRRGKKAAGLIDDDVKVRMGYFSSVDGEEHWGIEVVDDDSTHLEELTPGDDPKGPSPRVEEERAR